MSLRCPMPVLTFLACAVPFTALLWGSFWLWRHCWSVIPMDARDRQFFGSMLGWCALIIVELSVWVCVATDRPRP